MFLTNNKIITKVTTFLIIILAYANQFYAKDDDCKKRDSCCHKSENSIRFEHIGINVKDPITAARWYSENLNMKILREGTAPNYSTFVADSSIHMMIEFNYNKDFPTIDSLNFNYDSFHLAFCVFNINMIKEKLLNAGATVLSDLRKTDSGDQVLVLKDPWGLPIQFVQRVKPMINAEGIFIEHIAFNVSDSPAKSKWYVNNLNMEIMREGKAPSFGMFIADENKNVMFEFYQHQDSPVINFNDITHSTLHVAFVVQDIKALKEKLLTNEAELVNDIYQTPSGDYVMNFKDSTGLPLQFVSRVKPMLK
ncbi:MAG: VOC family protein [Melioribacter sp.]|nr:VOC family protein [Melioribacter sp.]